MTEATTDANGDDANDVHDERKPEMTTTSLDRAVEAVEADDGAVADDATRDGAPVPPKRTRQQINWTRVVTYGVLPGLALILFMVAGYLKWMDTTNRDSQIARAGRNDQ